MERIYDMIVIGGGPAGLSAGIYGGRAKLDVLVIEKENKGGQISLTSEVVNYPGILEISGTEFMTQTRKQAEGFGVNFVQGEVVDMDFTKDIKTVKTTLIVKWSRIGISSYKQRLDYHYSIRRHTKLHNYK